MNEQRDISTSDPGGGSSTEPLIMLSPTVITNPIILNPTNSAPTSTMISESSQAEHSAVNVSIRQPLQDNPQPSRTFSQALQHTDFPKKDQAIIFPSIEGIPIKEYIIALGTIIGAKNVKFASRISNRRVCIFLSTKNCVDEFISSHAGITIGDVLVSARRLITPANRIILSNVSPIIPHAIIEESLKTQGLKVVSPVSFVGVGVGVSEYSHVYSFRRQVFIVPDDKEIPKTMVINYDGDSYRIFLSNEDLKCFICKNEGHISKRCPNQKQPEANIETPPQETNCDLTEISQDYISTAAANTQQTVNPSGIKRLASTELPSNDDLISEHPDELTDKQKFRKPRRKKSRMHPDKPEVYDSIKHIFQEKSYVLDFENFKKFLTEVKGKSNPRQIAQKYTNETQLLIKMLLEIYPYIETRSLQERCKRLAAALSGDKDMSSSRGSDTSDYSDIP